MQQASKESNNIPLAAVARRLLSFKLTEKLQVLIGWEVMFHKARKHEKASVLPLILNKTDFKVKKKKPLRRLR